MSALVLPEYDLLELDSKMPALELPASFLNKIRCHRCNGYLVHSPIQLLPDGNSICGLCSKSTDEITQRQLTFENFLKGFKYPCKFRQNGCEEILTFEQIKEHEDECIYISHSCPAPSFCQWEGPTNAIPAHFLRSHFELVSDKLVCKIPLSVAGKRGFAMISKENISAIVKYRYINSRNNIQYCVQHFNGVDTKVAVRISLIHSLQPNCNINIKGGNSVLFNKDFYLDFKQVSATKTLDLVKYLPALDNPDCILLKLDVDGKIKNYVTPIPLNFGPSLQKLRCYMCEGFLLPPLYCDEQEKSPACRFCFYKFEDPMLIEDELLLDTVTKTNFPCRWRGCEIRKSGCVLPDHELSCLFRQIKCLACKEFVLKDNYLSHIKGHGYRTFNGHYSYVIEFIVGESIEICTVKGSNIVYLYCRTLQRNYIRNLHSFSITSLDDCQVNIEFEHEHCKVQPKALVLKSEKKSALNIFDKECWSKNTVKVYRDDLPSCYNDNKPVTVTIRY